MVKVIVRLRREARQCDIVEQPQPPHLWKSRFAILTPLETRTELRQGFQSIGTLSGFSALWAVNVSY